MLKTRFWLPDDAADPKPEVMPTPHYCIACDRGSDDVPLLTVEFRGRQFHICAQHLPVLIHDPGQLVGRLQGAETLRPSDHHD